jgi:uncharacterized protein with HEPN domain
MNPLEQLERQTRLWHIERAAATIIEFTSGRTETEYLEDDLLRSAVERQLITIGEALGRAVDADPDLMSRISDVRLIISLWNQLVHNYPQILLERIWGIVQDDLPKLLREVRILLNETPA